MPLSDRQDIINTDYPQLDGLNLIGIFHCLLQSFVMPAAVKDPPVILPATSKAFDPAIDTPDEMAIKVVPPEIIFEPAHAIPFEIPKVFKLRDEVEAKANSHFSTFTLDDFNDNSNPDPTTKLLEL